MRTYHQVNFSVYTVITGYSYSFFPFTQILYRLQYFIFRNTRSGSPHDTVSICLVII